MTKGIFEPLFDTADEADDMADAHLEAVAAGEGRLGAYRRMEEKEERREAQERRQKMILVERLIDEWDETKVFVRDRLRGVASLSRMRASARRVQENVSNNTLDVMAAVAERVYRRRMDREEAMNRLGRETPGVTARGRAVWSVFEGLIGQMERLGLIKVEFSDGPPVGRTDYQSVN